MSAHLRYKYCLVPMCNNTTHRTPNKLFLAFPKNTETREIWYNAMKRDPTKYKSISLKSHLHCCEDHFNLEEDVESYMRVKLMGGNLYLKSGVVPHKFDCQKRKLVPRSPPPAEQQISEGSINTVSPAILDSHTYFTTILGTAGINVATQTRSRGKINKAVQVKLKCHVRSKGTSTVQTDDIACRTSRLDNDRWTMRSRYRTPLSGLCMKCRGPLEMSTHLKYKYCMVPMCTNTTYKTPNKVFLCFPTNIKMRKKWCVAMKRDPAKNKTISLKSKLHCCEDHFNLDEDVENYMRLKLMGGRVYLKKTVIPHKFDCQKKTLPTPRLTGLKRRRLEASSIADNEPEPQPSTSAVNQQEPHHVATHTYSPANDNKVRGTSKSKLPTKATKNNSPKEVERVFISGGVIDGMKQEDEEDSYYLEGPDIVKLEPAESDETTSEHHSTPNSPILKSPIEFEVQMTNGHFRDSEFSNKKKKHVENECEVFGRVVGTLLNEMPVRDALELQLALQKTITDFRLRKY